MIDGGVRYHLPWQGLALRQVLLALPPVLAVARAGQGALTSVVTYVVGNVLMTALWGRLGVELRPDALVLHGIRRRVLPWARIERIERRKKWWGTSVKVYADGRGWTLRAPVHDRLGSPDPEFDAKLQTIQRAWAARRADRWTAADA